MACADIDVLLLGECADEDGYGAGMDNESGGAVLEGDMVGLGAVNDWSEPLKDGLASTWVVGLAATPVSDDSGDTSGLVADGRAESF